MDIDTDDYDPVDAEALKRSRAQLQELGHTGRTERQL